MSSFDTLVEQLAFGKETEKPSSSLGLYLSPDTIYLSETRLGKDGRLVVDHLVRIPIPVEGKTLGASGTMNADFLNDPQKVAGLIRQSMSQMRWNSKTVRVTLSHHLGLLRYFTMPAVDRRFLRSAVPLEAKKTIPIPFDVLAYDYQAAPIPPDAAGRQRLGVLIAVTQKKNVANVSGLLDALGLKLGGLELAPCSVLRLWEAVDPARDPSPFLQVHIDGGSVRIMVVDRGVPVFFREVFLPQAATADDLRKIDLTGCLMFVQKQLGVTGISRLRVSGGLPNLEALKDAFAQETGLPAVLQDTPKLLSVKSCDWGGYASLGASARSLAPAAEVLDLAASDRVTDEERQTARDIILAGAACAGLLALAGLFTSATYSFRARELHDYQRKLAPDVKMALQGMDNMSIENLLKDMQSQLDQMKGVVSDDRPRISEILRQSIEIMPEKIWLNRISIQNPLQANEKQRLTIQLTGHAQDRSVGEEQALAFRYKDLMAADPRLGKRFEVSISVQKQSGSEASESQGLDPKALAERLESRTQFTLTLTAKR